MPTKTARKSFSGKEISLVLHTVSPSFLLSSALQRLQNNEVSLTDGHLEEDDKQLSQVFNKELPTARGRLNMTVGDILERGS